MGAFGEGRFAEVRLSESRMGLAAAEARLDEWRARLEQAEHELAMRGELLDEARAEAASLRAEQAALTASAEQERKAAQEKLELLERSIAEAETRLRDTFAALSSDALRRNNQSFLDLAKETLASFQQQASGDLERRQQAITEVVTPIKDSLAKVDEKIRDIEKQRVDAYATLHEQVRSLGETQRTLHAETSNLVRALRTPNVRGRWGEITLRRVVEMAGMLEHCDFDEQATHDTGDGRIRPDLTVRLPGGKLRQNLAGDFGVIDAGHVHKFNNDVWRFLLIGLHNGGVLFFVFLKAQGHGVLHRRRGQCAADVEANGQPGGPGG